MIIRMVNKAKNSRRSLTLRERLLSCTQLDANGCLIFTGSVHKTRGYGSIGVGAGKTRETHRVAWEVEHGPIPAGLSVLHRCDVPACINPEHLFLGTHADNMADMKMKGRAVGLRGLSNANARLSSEEVAEIRATHVPQMRSKRGTGCSTPELAERFGITPAYVWQIVTGKWRKSA